MYCIFLILLAVFLVLTTREEEHGPILVRLAHLYSILFQTRIPALHLGLFLPNAISESCMPWSA